VVCCILNRIAVHVCVFAVLIPVDLVQKCFRPVNVKRAFASTPLHVLESQSNSVHHHVVAIIFVRGVVESVAS